MRTQTGAGVSVEDHGDRLYLRADNELTGIATDHFDRPTSYVAWRPADGPDAADVRVGGTIWTQFALPVDSDSRLQFRFDHGDFLVSPEVVFPLWARRRDGAACLLAPLNHFHEQIVAVVDGELQWGWHGDLDEIPAGFTIELGIFTGTSVRALLEQWGHELRRRSGAAPRDRYADTCVSHLSYWTDNGAAYWYRREPGMGIDETLERKCTELRDLEIPIGAVELDSWFYPHAVPRSVNEVGYLDEVPPSGMLRWEPREDLFPDGLPALRRRLGDPAWIFHSRHVAASSPYVDQTWWIDNDIAHPADPAFFRKWMADARRWGAVTYEQDWMFIIWFGVRQLREAVGRTGAWQHGLDRAARENDLSLLWCMSIPPDFALATELEGVGAIRTCDDYRYAADPAILWTWFLVVNNLAAALQLWPFKDVFFSAAEARGGEDGKSIDGDPHAELEAALAALSGGPVGIGDRIGRTEPGVVRRTCRADGLLLKPDRPLAALDASLLGGPARGEGLLWADSASGEWRYVLAIHTGPAERSIADRLQLDETMLVYDWRSGEAHPGDAIELTLAARDWRLFVCCPIADERAWIGDPDRYATMADRRIRVLDDRHADVFGAADEIVRIRTWSARTGITTRTLRMDASGRASVDFA